MRILVNTRLLIKNKLDGIGWFTFETLKRITQQHQEHEFIFLFDRPFSKEFLFGENVVPFQIGPPARHPILWWIWFENSVPRIINRFQPDVFLSPDGYLTLKTFAPQLAVMHDINFEHYPQDLPFFYRKYYRYFFPKFAQKATRIATVSEFSKQDLSKTYGIDSQKIDVVYNGCNERYLPIAPQDAEETRKKYAQDCDYFLFIGSFHPRKNLVRMLKAFELFKQKHPSKVKLLLVGSSFWVTPEMKTAFETNAFKDEILSPGRLSPEALEKVIGAARAMLYVSYFEGFGIPVLEGMQAGIPVIASNKTSIPEVGGDAIEYVNPFDENDIAEAMFRVHFLDDRREKLIQKGLKQAAEFSWQKTADKLWLSIEKTSHA